MAVEEYRRGIPEYADKTGKRFGLLCETKEGCIVDESGVRLDQKLEAMQNQIGGVSTDITETINAIVDEKVETLTPEDIGAVPRTSGHFHISQSGWNRIGKIDKLFNSCNFILSAARYYNHDFPETFSVQISIAKNLESGNEAIVSVNQLSHSGYVYLLPKIRIVTSKSWSAEVGAYIDVFLDGGNPSGNAFVYAFDNCVFSDPNSISITESHDAPFDSETELSYEYVFDKNNSSVVDFARNNVAKISGNFVASTPGWYRVGVISHTRSAGNFILSISREYYSITPETLKCVVSFVDGSEMKLNVMQLGYEGYTKTFTKIRLVRNDDNDSSYIDIYTNGASTNGYYFEIDSLNSCGRGEVEPILLLPETSDATFDEETQIAYECELDTTQSSVVDYARNNVKKFVGEFNAPTEETWIRILQLKPGSGVDFSFHLNFSKWFGNQVNEIRWLATTINLIPGSGITLGGTVLSSERYQNKNFSIKRIRVVSSKEAASYQYPIYLDVLCSNGANDNVLFEISNYLTNDYYDASKDPIIYDSSNRPEATYDPETENVADWWFPENSGSMAKYANQILNDKIEVGTNGQTVIATYPKESWELSAPDESNSSTWCFYDRNDQGKFQRVAGIGCVAIGTKFNYMFLGVGNVPWDKNKGLTITKDNIKWKDKDLQVVDGDIGVTTQKINVIKNASFHMSHDNQSTPDTLYAQGIIFHQNEDGAVEGGVVINGMNGVATEINIAMGENPSDDGAGLTITKQGIYWKRIKMADDNGLATAASAKLLEVLNSNEVNLKNLPASGALWINYADVSGTMGEARGINYIFGNGHGDSTKTAITTGKILVGGDNVSTGEATACFGGLNTVSSDGSVAIGTRNRIDTWTSVAIGDSNDLATSASLVVGQGLVGTSDTSLATGHFNKVGTEVLAFSIGNGGSKTNRNNAFGVTVTGNVKAAGTFNASTAADYAENFEWADGNLEYEDRVGHFVTLDGDKIRIANADDDYILGIISGKPAILGNSDCDSWNGMYLRDEFGREITEPKPKTELIQLTEEVDNIDPETGEVVGTKTVMTGVEERQVFDDDGNLVYEGTRPIVNPAYNPEQLYISRADRPEWDAVGMLGVLAVWDDGSCEVNSYCKVADGGIATNSYSGEYEIVDGSIKRRYRVISRVTENIIKVVFR